MTQRKLLRHETAERNAGHVRAADTEKLQQRRHIVRQQRDRLRPVGLI